jgi:Flp pilus assembly protein TadG
MKIKSSIKSAWLRAEFLLEQFRREARGVAAVEFAFIAPIMILLFVGTIELSAGISTNRKLSRVSSAVSDLVTQSQSLTQNDILNIMDISAKIMYPYKETVEIEVNGIQISSGQSRAKWRCNLSTSSCTNIDETYDVPTKIKKDGTYLVAAEVTTTYTPSFGWAHYQKDKGVYFSRTPISMREELFLRPRIGSSVTLK